MARALDIGEVPGLLEAIIPGLDPAVEVKRDGEDVSGTSDRPALRSSS